MLQTTRVANGIEAPLEAIENLSLPSDDGFVPLLKDVLFVPSLRRNLILVSKLDEQNIHCHFGDHICIV